MLIFKMRSYLPYVNKFRILKQIFLCHIKPMIPHHILKQLISLNIFVLSTLYVQNNGLKLLLNTNFKSKMSSVLLFLHSKPKISIKFHCFKKVYRILQIENSLRFFNSYICMNEHIEYIYIFPLIRMYICIFV